MEALTKDFKSVMGNTLPIIILVSVMAIFLRIYILKKTERKIFLSKEIPSLFFLIYILCLFQIVTSHDVSGIHGINIDLFKELTRYQIGSHLFYRNVIGNIVLFIPFTFFVAHLFKVRSHLVMYLFTLLISLTIETTQLYIGRAFDIDDIILNVIGGIIGFLIYNFVSNILLKNVKEDKKNIIIAILLVIIVLGIFIIIL